MLVSIHEKVDEECQTNAKNDRNSQRMGSAARCGLDSHQFTSVLPVAPASHQRRVNISPCWDSSGASVTRLFPRLWGQRIAGLFLDLQFNYSGRVDGEVFISGLVDGKARLGASLKQWYVLPSPRVWLLILETRLWLAGLRAFIVRKRRD